MRPDSIPIDHVLNVAQLLATVGPGLGFSTHSLVQQLSECDDNGEPFFLRQGDVNYMVSAADLKVFFAGHEKPKRAMSKEEENKLLKSQIKAMETEMLKLKGQQIKEIKPIPEIPSVGPEEQTEPLEPEALPLDDLKNEPKMTSEQVQELLAQELRDKVPYAPSEAAKRGRPRKIV